MTALNDHIRRSIVSALAEYEMIAPNDRVMVAMSGGKDSAVLLMMLEEIRRRAPFPFSLHPVMLDQKQPGFAPEEFLAWFAARNLPVTVIGEDTYAIVKDKTAPGKTYCGLCSRLRRGILYNYAHAQGYNKIALGHHRDDLNETVLLNMFFVGRTASMPPKLFADDGRNTVIRPLCFVGEDDILQLAAKEGIPLIPCNLCGSQENMRRKEIKALLKSLEQKIPRVQESLLAAQRNLRPTQLADQRFWHLDDSEETTGSSQAATGLDRQSGQTQTPAL